jgi:WD40 repeat protein
MNPLTNPILICNKSGINNKTVRVYDIRSPGKPTQTTNSRATAGLAVDPASEYRVAGSVDTQVQIRFAEPQMLFSQPLSGGHLGYKEL